MVRSNDRRIAGVAGGIAEYFGIDPVIVRLAFVVAIFVGGTGLLAYAIAWAVLPNADDSQSGRARGPLDPTTVLALVALGIAAWIGIAEPFDGGVLVPVLLVAAGIYLLTQRPDEPGVDAVGPVPRREPLPTVPPPSAPPGTGTDTTKEMWVPPRRPPREPSIVTRVALSALALLTAGAIALDSAGWADVSGPTVFALGLVVVGVAAVTGAFIGRARGIILIGIVLAVGLVIANVIEPVFEDGVGERRYAPASLAELDDRYELGIGELVVDLRALEIDRDDTVQVRIELGIGEARVIVPPDVDLRVTGDLDIGEIEALGLRESGIGNEVSVDDAGTGAGTLIVDLEVGIGHGEVRRG